MTLPKQVDEQRLAEACTPIIHRHGLVLESLATQRVGASTRVNIVVDLPEDQIGSADLDAVTEASREISDLLDADASYIGEGPSQLEVTTPGVFRPLKERRHFLRSRTRLMAVTDTSRRQFVGRLMDVDGDTLVFEVIKPAHQPKKSAKHAERDAMIERVPPGPHRMSIADVQQAEIELEFR